MGGNNATGLVPTVGKDFHLFGLALHIQNKYHSSKTLLYHLESKGYYDVLSAAHFISDSDSNSFGLQRSNSSREFSSRIRMFLLTESRAFGLQRFNTSRKFSSRIRMFFVDKE